MTCYAHHLLPAQVLILCLYHSSLLLIPSSPLPVQTLLLPRPLTGTATPLTTTLITFLLSLSSSTTSTGRTGRYYPTTNCHLSLLGPTAHPALLLYTSPSPALPSQPYQPIATTCHPPLQLATLHPACGVCPSPAKIDPQPYLPGRTPKGTRNYIFLFTQIDQGTRAQELVR